MHLDELARVTLPLAMARGLPARAYTDAEVFTFERNVLFLKSWACVGRVSDVADPGAYTTTEVAGHGVLVARGRDKVLRAFHNICRHRGMPLASAPAGKCELFECPYHGWKYGTDGALHRPDNLSNEGLGLRPVALATWQGFVFVHLDPTALSLDSWMGRLPPWLIRNDLQNLRRARSVVHEVVADWKLLVANFQESHHFPRVHPSLEALTPTTHARSHFTDGVWLGGTMVINAKTVSTSGQLRDRRLIVCREDAHRVFDALLSPCFLTSLQPDYLLTYRLEPLAAGRTRVTAETFVHGDLPEDAELSEVFDFWDRINAEDRAVCEAQQRGVASSGFLPGPYVEADEGVHAFEQSIARAHLGVQPSAHGKLVGIWGRPFIDLSPHLDTACLPTLDIEVSLALARVETGYTGGTLKWMGVVAPWMTNDDYLDAMHVIRAFSRDEFARFLSLGDAPTTDYDLARQSDYEFGDETDHPFNSAQARYLSARHGVYFPWKSCYHFLENDRWEDKHSGRDKTFTAEAEEHFPETLRFIRSLPFREIGRAVLFGIEPNDHAPAHRDTEPGVSLQIAQSISFDPRGDKGMYLRDAEGGSHTVIHAPIYWFNDMDYHGVDPAPRFRYSIRVDGVFEPDFIKRVRARAR